MTDSLESRLTNLEDVVADLLDPSPAGEDGAELPPATGATETDWTRTWEDVARRDPETCAARWAELGEWVEWLDRSILRWQSNKGWRIEPCWWKHPVAVEQLTALMLAHRVALANPDSFDLMHWFTTEGLWATLRDFAAMDVFGNCRTSGSHVDDRPSEHFEVSDDFLRGMPNG